MKRRKLRRKTPKIKLSRFKILLFLSAIFLVCFGMLFLSTLFAPDNNGTTIAADTKISGTESSTAVTDSVPPVQNVPGEQKKTPPAGSAAGKVKTDRVSGIRQKAPKKEKEKPAAVPFSIPEAGRGAVLVFVFDDAGSSLTQLQRYLDLPFPLSIAVLPRLAYSVASAERIRKAGKEVLLHQPMQALSADINPGPGSILPDMGTVEIESIVKQNIAEIGPVAGVNNHEGSLICENEQQIGAVLRAVHDSGVYFLDSRTTAQTKVPQVAADLGFPYYQRDIFLDNPKTKEHILEELHRGLEEADKKGFAIMIGHVWSADLIPAILADLYPLLKEKGYTFSTVSGSGGEIQP